MDVRETAVLGAGPAGLTAAWTALRYGEITIYSIKKRSAQHGAQYLHNPIPLANDREPHGTINNYFIGTPQGYRDKVYGTDLVASDTSFANMPERQPAWDLRRTYEWLWDRLEHRIVDTPVHAGLLEGSIQRGETVISSVPADAICMVPEKHQFQAYTVGITPVDPVDDEHFVVYNGDPSVPWYRWSQVFGYGQVEWPLSVAPDEAVAVKKPVYNNCSCWLPVHRVGRYGRWRKGVLVDDVVGAVDRIFAGESP